MPFTFPRTNERASKPDNGAPVENKRCWNCGGLRYRITVSTESCPDCGIECDYWGGGANAAYDAASTRQEQAREQAEDQARQRREDEEERRRMRNEYDEIEYQD